MTATGRVGEESQTETGVRPKKEEGVLNSKLLEDSNRVKDLGE